MLFQKAEQNRVDFSKLLSKYFDAVSK